jgi:peptide deformylase
MKLKIRCVPDHILRQKSKPVLKIDKKIKKMAKEMINFLAKGTKGKRIGVGLSAVQIGKPLRLFIAFDPQKEKDKVFLNPQITWQSKKMTKGVPESENENEGCLSVPGYWGKVKRHWQIKLAYQDLQGKKHHQKFKGFLSTVIQHETDHLNGILFVDRILKQKGKIYKVEKDKEGQEVLVEVKFP